MGLLFYASDLNGTGKPVWDLYQDLAADYTSEFCQTLNDLTKHLRQFHSDPQIAVLLAGSRKELLEIISIRNLIDGFRLILILPDNKKATVNKGHSLYPRFLTYVDGNFDWVAAVLEKMLTNNHTGMKGELW